MVPVRRSALIARALLIAAALICGIGMMGPWRHAEAAVVPWDKAAHFMAFYGLTLLMLAAFPTRRRLDVACLAILAGVGVEVVQKLSGSDAELGDIIADSAGVFAVIAPMWVENLRGLPREERRKGLLARLATEPAPETEYQAS